MQSAMIADTSMVTKTGVMLSRDTTAAMAPIIAPKLKEKVVDSEAALPACSSKKLINRADVVGIMEPFIMTRTLIKAAADQALKLSVRLSTTNIEELKI